MRTDTHIGSLPATLEYNEETGEVGWYCGGGVALYTTSAVDMVGRADDWHAARRVIRRARKARADGTGRPTRIRVSIWRDSDHDEPCDVCEVYGWRAALEAARWLRRDLGCAPRCYEHDGAVMPAGRGHAWVCVEDSEWADARDRYYAEGGAEAWDSDYHADAPWLRG